MTQQRSRTALWVTAAGLLVACSGAPDPTVQFDMEIAPFQPWVATGELVDAGEVCPTGTRNNVGLAWPDGSPMTMEEWSNQVGPRVDEGMGWREITEEFQFLSWEEYICDDGSGTFTIKEESGEGGHGEVVESTGTYLGMTGDCTNTMEFDDAGEPIAAASTCNFDMGESDV
ncbi:MAG: hypothetical protein QNJ77_06135 [Acidimicrobiia bacterium]|nr:hypothetical protein [Acidimicrobiia bacterium]